MSFNFAGKSFASFLASYTQPAPLQKPGESIVNWSEMQSIFESEFNEASSEFAKLGKIWIIWMAFNRKWIELVATSENSKEISAFQIPIECSEMAQYSNCSNGAILINSVPSGKTEIKCVQTKWTETLEESVLNEAIVKGDSRVVWVKLTD